MRTPIEDDCFRQGREAAHRGEPKRTTAPMFWSQSMIDAYDDGFREGMDPHDRFILDGETVRQRHNKTLEEMRAELSS